MAARIGKNGECCARLGRGDWTMISAADVGINGRRTAG
jgi:hypothetical protein